MPSVYIEALLTLATLSIVASVGLLIRLSMQQTTLAVRLDMVEKRLDSYQILLDRLFFRRFPDVYSQENGDSSGVRSR